MLIEPHDAVLVAQQMVTDFAQELWVEEGTPIFFDESFPGHVRLEGIDNVFAPETRGAEDFYRSLLEELVPDRPFTYQSTIFGGWNTLVVHQFGSTDDTFYATIAVDKEGSGIVSIETDDTSISKVIDFTKEVDDYLWQCLNPAEATIGQSADGDMEMRLFVGFIQPHLGRSLFVSADEVSDSNYDVYQDSFGDTR